MEFEKIKQEFASKKVDTQEFDISKVHSKKLRTRDTHIWKDSHYGGTVTSQLDYIILSPSLKKALKEAGVAHGKNSAGSDHYLLWAELDLEKM